MQLLVMEHVPLLLVMWHDGIQPSLYNHGPDHKKNALKTKSTVHLEIVYFRL